MFPALPGRTMARLPALSASLLLLALVGCSGKAGVDTGPGADTAPPVAPCDVRLVETEPADGIADAYYRQPIEFELTDPDPTATVSIDGVPGTVTRRGTRDQIVVFTPDAPLAPASSYTATLGWCGGTSTLGFGTSDAGLPIDDTAALAGRVFSVPFQSGRIVEPDGVAGLVRQYLAQTDLLRIDAAAGGTLAATNALAVTGADPVVQDWCVPTVSFDESDFSDAPAFALSADSARLVLAGVVVELRNLQVSGAFLPDGRTIAGGEVRYVLDMRALAALVDASDPGSVCAAAEGFSEPCQPCPGSGEPFCLTFHLDKLEGTWVEGLGLDPVPGADCPDCATSPPAEEATCD